MDLISLKKLLKFLLCESWTVTWKVVQLIKILPQSVRYCDKTQGQFFKGHYQAQS